jgi:hypothetical protein
MPWAAGSYTKGNAGTGGWTGDASLGIGIEAGRHDTQDNDFATGINQCLNKDGSNSMAGNLNFGNNQAMNISRVGVGTATPTAGVIDALCESTNAIGLAQRGRASDNVGVTLFTQSDGTEVARIVSAPTYLQINKSGSNPVSIGTNSVQRQTWFGTGDSVIGQTTLPFSPSGRLAVVKDATAAIDAYINAAGLGVPAIRFFKFDNNTTTSNIFALFYINGGNAASGSITANGANQATFTSTSDERVKENITDLPSQLANIMSLRPVEFDYKDGSGHQIGFIAQEVQEIYPDLVGQGPDGFYTLSGLGKNESRMIKAFQEFAELTQQKIAALEARIEALEA